MPHIFKSQKWGIKWFKSVERVMTKSLSYRQNFYSILSSHISSFCRQCVGLPRIKTFTYYERIRKCHFSCFNVISKALLSFFMATILREIYELRLCLVCVCQNRVSMIMEESSVRKRSHINNKRKSWTCLFSFFVAKACVRANYCCMTIDCQLLWFLVSVSILFFIIWTRY